MVRKRFDMGIFCVLRRTHCNLILPLPAIARLGEVGWDATGVKWFPPEYEQSKFYFHSFGPRSGA